MWIYPNRPNYTLHILNTSLQKCLVVRTSLEAWLNQSKAENKQWLGQCAGRKQQAIPQAAILQDYFSEEIPEAQYPDERRKMDFWSLNFYGLCNGFWRNRQTTHETAVVTYISKTHSETPVHFMTRVSKIVWVSQTSYFFRPSPKVKVSWEWMVRKRILMQATLYSVRSEYEYAVAIVAIQWWLSLKV